MKKKFTSPEMILGYGRAASSCGDQLLEMTVIWSVWQTTQSPAILGAAAFVMRAPFWIFGFFGASLADRTGALEMLWRVNVASSVIGLLALLLLSFGCNSPVVAIISALVIGVFRAIEAPALAAAVPLIAGTWKTLSLNNALDYAKRIGRMLAPAPAMLLGLVSPSVLVGIASSFFFVMALTVRKLRKHATQRINSPLQTSKSATQVIREIYTIESLKWILGGSVIYAIFHGAAYFSIIPVLALSDKAGQPGGYASLVFAFALGGLISNLAIALTSIHHEVKPIAFAMVVIAFAFALIGQVEAGAWRFVGAVLAGCSLPFQDVFIVLIIQKRAPSHVVARAHAIWRLGCELGLGLGMIAGGILAGLVQPSRLLVLVGIGILFAAQITWLASQAIDEDTARDISK